MVTWGCSCGQTNWLMDRHNENITFPQLSRQVLIISRELANFLITAHQWSCRKVMFLHLSIILFTGGRGLYSRWNPPGQRPLPGQRPPPWTEDSPLDRAPPRTEIPWMETYPPGLISSSGHRSGRYASYWNVWSLVDSSYSYIRQFRDRT